MKILINNILILGSFFVQLMSHGIVKWYVLDTMIFATIPLLS